VAVEVVADVEGPDEADDAAEVGADADWAETALEEDALVPPLPELPEGLEYRSAYQPPPLRMKLPADTSRLAVFFWQAGQVSKAGSTMRCSCSHSCPQEEHWYS
jgi:hypothetical protein